MPVDLRCQLDLASLGSPISLIPFPAGYVIASAMPAMLCHAPACVIGPAGRSRGWSIERAGGDTIPNPSRRRGGVQEGEEAHIQRAHKQHAICRSPPLSQPWPAAWHAAVLRYIAVRHQHSRAGGRACVFPEYSWSGRVGRAVAVTGGIETAAACHAGQQAGRQAGRQGRGEEGEEEELTVSPASP